MAPTMVNDMRKELLKLGVNEAEVASMNKSQLKSKLTEIYTQKTDEDMAFTMEDIEDEPETISDALGVKYASQEWSDYVMGLFNPDEMISGYPKINGLRRVANYLLGDIVESIPVQVTVIGGAGEKTVVVSYKISIEWKIDYPVGFGNLSIPKQIRTFGGVADCNESPEVYGKHPSATAESKAEGRALRKALCLNVIAAEEMMSGEDSEISGIPKGTSKITSALKSVITGKCKALHLSPHDVIKDIGIKNSFDNLTMAEGQQVFENLNKRQQKT